MIYLVFEILFFVILAALLGLAVGWLLRGGSVRRLKRSEAALRAELEALRSAAKASPAVASEPAVPDTGDRQREAAARPKPVGPPARDGAPSTSDRGDPGAEETAKSGAPAAPADQEAEAREPRLRPALRVGAARREADGPGQHRDPGSERLPAEERPERGMKP